MACQEEQSIEGKVISINPDEDDSFAAENFNLVGKILSDKEVSFNTCRAALLGIWGHPEGVAISDVGRNKLFISFKDVRKGIQIRNGGPWSVRGHLLNLQIWNGRESVYEVDHKYMELWVQIHGFSLSYIIRKTAEIIGKKIGTVMETENSRLNDTLQRMFLRVRVTMNITKPLPTGFWLATQNHQTLWVDFKYERIQDSYCLNCGILGHTKKECRSPMAMASWDHMQPRYGLGLGVNRVRAISAREKEQDEKEMNREWTEAKQDCEGERARMEHMKEHSAEESSTGRGLQTGPLRNLEANSDQQTALGRESQGSRLHVEVGKALRKGNKSTNTRTDIIKGYDKLQEIGEVSCAFRPNDTFSLEQEASGPFHSQIIHKGCQEHLEVGENEECQPFGNRTRLNEGCLDEPKQMEDCFQCQQGRIGEIFWQERSPTKHHGNVEIYKQSEMETRIVRHSAGQLWSYRDKPKMKRIVTAASRTMIQRMDNGEEYYVELVEEQQQMEEETAAGSEQRNESQRVLELAFDMGLNLDSKRSRDTSSLAVYRRAFQHATLSALPAISSDHTPLVLNVTPRGIRSRCFKFETFWADHADCGNIIRRGWNSVCNSTVDHWTNLTRMMNSCKQELVKWNKVNFKRADVEIQKQMYSLKLAEEREYSDTQQQEISNLKMDIIRLWKQEEKYWGQRSRVKWLKFGDKNTELISEGQGWNISELRKHFDGDTVGKIIRTPVSVIGREDKLSWPLKPDGKYTIKMGYHAARKEQHLDNNNSPSTSDDFKDLWRDIWKLRVPQKIRTFLWRASHNILPVFQNLYNKKISNTPICPICLQEPESTEHALLLCPWTRAAWFGAQIQCCPTAHTVSSFGKWVIDLFKNMKVGTGTDYELCSSRVGFFGMGGVERKKSRSASEVQT
ncbi:hypothetical protein Ahy_A07g033454 [Arachis hypogaea]|uniref:CCHC-type domain-containing protein n=1 Tax=Arachis hypogaea TaxID=3818 RepID=A0A445C9A7_ARAHY|nr:hypothetical protein Ahy_A07g033454 [Arachis hypogaea]